MKTLTALLMLASAAHAQIITCTPTNYSQSIVSQNNVGRVRNSWRNNVRDDIVLGSLILVFTHTVYFDTPFAGTKWGGPKLLEDRYVYRQVGSAAYYPMAGQNVTFFAPKVAGGWIATTNAVPISDMSPLFWLPTFVGTVTIGDGNSRTVTTASSLECFGRNLANAPYLLRVMCAGGGEDFEFLLRFEANQRKTFSIGTAPSGSAWLSFDLDSTNAEPL